MLLSFVIKRLVGCSEVTNRNYNPKVNLLISLEKYIVWCLFETDDYVFKGASFIFSLFQFKAQISRRTG